MESSKGSTWIRFPYLMSWHAWTVAMSPSLRRRLFRATEAREVLISCVSSTKLTGDTALTLVDLDLALVDVLGGENNED
jgi:hypothetical protein